MNIHIILPLLLLWLLYMTFKSCKRANARVKALERLNRQLSYQIKILEKRIKKLKDHN